MGGAPRSLASFTLLKAAQPCFADTIEKSLELPLDAAELANQATKLLEEHDFTEVLNKISDDAFSDFFAGNSLLFVFSQYISSVRGCCKVHGTVNGYHQRVIRTCVERDELAASSPRNRSLS